MNVQIITKKKKKNRKSDQSRLVYVVLGEHVV